MSGFDFAALERRIAALEANRGASLRFGTVTASDPKTGAARVQLEDGNGMVTHPLRVLQERTLKDKRQTMPDIGEPVAVLFAGQGMEQGVVLGACYSTKTPPPGKPGQQDYTIYEDGTELWYDRDAHKLVAKVMGSVEMEVEGSVRVSSSYDIVVDAERSIILKAPKINLAGKLSITDRDGRAGSGDLFGDYRILKGSLTVPEGDVIAGITKLREHTHSGVERGSSSTDIPVNATTDGDAGLTEDDERERIFDTLTSQMDQLILCLPDIASMEYGRAFFQHDKDGWALLAELMLKWRNFKAHVFAKDDKEKRIYDLGVLHPTFISWDWLFKYSRVKDTWIKLSSTQQLFTKNSINTLTHILHLEGAFTKEEHEFDHIATDWRLWRAKAFQGAPCNLNLQGVALNGSPDGLAASIGSFTIFALAKGTCKRLMDGSYTITIRAVSFFIFDGFDFNGDQWLGRWRCSPTFDFSILYGKDVTNEDFRVFRRRTGYGSDFRVVAPPKLCDEVNIRLPLDFDVKGY